MVARRWVVPVWTGTASTGTASVIRSLLVDGMTAGFGFGIGIGIEIGIGIGTERPQQREDRSRPRHLGGTGVAQKFDVVYR
jgi:hypothetical protein